ncbi:MAG: hypothetical protein JW864_14310 [Spirochaetes bacterium]|nr:hypothetical protein [Spirochaetota bacterium]
MKKIMVSLAVTAFCIASYTNPLFEKKASAAGFSAGVSTWYAWWKFSESDNMDMKPAFLFGPVLSFGFGGSYSLSGVFLYGKFKPEDTEDGPSDISRFDSDISLNYNINRYFKIFGGAKYMDFRWEDNYSEGKHYSVGPGLGVGITIPLAGSFYFLTNLSGTYTLGEHVQDESNETGGTVTMTSDLAETGINTNISVACYIATASTSLTLGLRYQYVISDYKDESEHMQDEKFTFYGITLSAVYTF